MNFTEYDIRKKYRYSNLSYVFDVYIECEYRANLTQNRYNGLEPGEFRFDYKSWAYRLGVTKKQLERAIKELTTENIVIIQIEKGTRGTSSKYFLARFEENDNSSNINSLEVVKENNIEEKKKERNKEHVKRMIGEEKNVKNTSVNKCLGEQKGDDKEKFKEKKKEQSSQYNNLNIISNNIYSHWNSKKIIVHKSLNKDIEKAIEKALKKYSEEEIVRAIETYDEILKDDGYYFNYKWGLKDFLGRSNGISTFMDDGNNKVNYEDHKKKNTQSKKVVNYDSYID
ncbi:hypothetical protein LF65_05697 [Clostridium beijerinckii]|uniref:Uncharacterized protein n=1 Tax=Clostridium beijerinckii TaxID=1520 RepID=A0A0B5QYX1_CLOBE|nr:hypothetical protein [Clostridium beijerinckii]AJH02204.1 hypothetical protein LF65_05697 [Clostridium beijerinckii]